MGGEREFVVKSKSTPVQESPDQVTIIQTEQTVRIHEKRILKEIHFHDDTNHLKVAMPTGRWYRAWEEMSKEFGPWCYVDAVRKTILKIEFDDNQTADGRSLETKLRIEKLADVGPTFAAVAKFSEGK